MTKIKDTGVRDRVMALIGASAATMADFDQRSAIGMARSWVEDGKAIKRNDFQHEMKGRYTRRDDLAEALVEAMKGGEPAECIAALSVAREFINKPFEDPNMLGYRTARLAAGAVGSEKKGAKIGLGTNGNG
jgi:hypothetical protein